MISITSKSPYAVLALAELGRSAGSGPVPIGDVSFCLVAWQCRGTGGKDLVAQ